MNASSAHVREIPYAADAAVRFSQLADGTWPVLLDSCRHRVPYGRYDIMAVNPMVRVTATGDEITIERGHGAGAEREVRQGDPLSVLKSLLDAYPPVASDLPFAGGAIGYFSYDLGRGIEGIADAGNARVDVPDLAIGIYDWAIVQDHDARRAWLVRAGYDSAPEGLPSDELPATVTPAAFGPRFQVRSAVEREIDFPTYRAAIERILRYIRDGDCYQVNFTQQFFAPASGDPWDGFLRLRALNPAPYAAYLGYPFGAVLSSSPEQFLKVTGGAVSTRPIKGTRARSGDAAEDRWLAERLIASEKDRAENVMIVDLLRNDLGKNCAVGSVAVPKLFALESFATVHHLVSSVVGQLAPDRHVLDLLRGAFPGGSITGAPKRRAMEIIEELEPSRRSVYCGAIGYVSFSGDMDTNIAIRTMLYSGGMLRCWAGGGIVIDSSPEDEYQESLDKAAAMLAVFAAALAADAPG